MINDERTKNAETALAAHAKRTATRQAGQRKRPDKLEDSDYDVTCGNCKKPGHVEADCYAKGGGKEGQAPWQKRKSEKTETATVAAVNDDNDELFAFTCTSDYADFAAILQLPKSKLSTCVDSGVSCDYSPDHSKFSNYRAVIET